jgi:hypothetical protein
MHVTCMQPIERTKGERSTMHDYVMRELVERRHEKGRVLRREGGRGRACSAGADGEGKSQGNHLEPQYEPQPQMEMEHQMEDDVEAQEVGDDEQ